MNQFAPHFPPPDTMPEQLMPNWIYKVLAAAIEKNNGHFLDDKQKKDIELFVFSRFFIIQ